LATTKLVTGVEHTCHQFWFLCALASGGKDLPDGPKRPWPWFTAEYHSGTTQTLQVDYKMPVL